MQVNGNDDLVLNLYVDDYRTAMFTFHRPQNGRFGEPIATTFFQSSQGDLTYEYFSGFTADGKHAWGSGYNNISLYNYPAGGVPILSLKGAALTACYMAVVPPLKP